MRTEKLKTNLSASEARELAQPLSATPGLSVETTAAQNAALANPNFDTQLNAPMGLVSKRLFDTRTENDRERFERLEAAVQALRDDFDKTSPSINRLMAIEQEIQTLVDQLQSLVGEDASMADAPVPPVSAEMLEEDFPVSPASPPLMPNVAPVELPQQEPQPEPVEPVAAAVPETPVATQPVAATASGPSLSGLRMADHGATARIVFETTDRIEYSASVDPEKFLLVNFASGTSGLSAEQLRPKSDVIKTVDVTPQANGGFIVAMGLSKTTKIVRQGILAPDASNPRYRIYIDIER